MGWQNAFAVIFQAGNTIINPQGVFVYNGPPAHGNLVASSAGTAGTDDGFGNPYGSGDKVYGTDGSSVQIRPSSGVSPAQVRIGTGDVAELTPGILATLIQGGPGPTRALASILQGPIVTGQVGAAQISMYSASVDLVSPGNAIGFNTTGAGTGAMNLGPVNWSVDLNDSAGTGNDVSVSLQAANVNSPLGIIFTGIVASVVTRILAMGTTGMVAGVQIRAQDPVLSPVNQETFHIATLTAPWVTAAENLEYSLMPDNTVQVTGELTIPAGTANPTTITTIATAAYHPQRAEFLSAIENGGAPFTGIPHICQINTTGAIQVFGALTAANTLRVWGRYPLGS